MKFTKPSVVLKFLCGNVSYYSTWTLGFYIINFFQITKENVNFSVVQIHRQEELIKTQIHLQKNELIPDQIQNLYNNLAEFKLIF